MVRLLILGAGSMAARHAAAFKAIPGCEIAAVVEPNDARLAAFVEIHKIKRGFADLDSAIAWDGFDAVANVTPDVVHYPTTMSLISAGKHVFCEKPLATDYPRARQMAEAAEASGLVNMVNLIYRNCTALQRAREIVVSGGIGEVRHFEASYLQNWLVGPQQGDWRSEERWLWRLSSAHGSRGALGDIGIHIVDFATYAAASDIVSMTGRLGVFSKAPNDRIGDYLLDANDSFVMSVELANRALGLIHATRWATGHVNDLKLTLFGGHGALEVKTDGRVHSLRICAGEDVHSQTWREVDCPETATTYQRFIAAVRSKRNGDPDFRRAADVQQILDLCLISNGNEATLTPPP